jgi:hypothetical protein
MQTVFFTKKTKWQSEKLDLTLICLGILKKVMQIYNKRKNSISQDDDDLVIWGNNIELYYIT